MESAEVQGTDELPSGNVSVLPGQIVDDATLARANAKTQLLELIHRFAREGLPSGYASVAKITSETAAARVLFNALPSDAKLPKIAPEGEGGLTAIWNEQDSPVILIVEDWKLHLIRAATTPQATYHDDLPFDGEKVPNEVIDAIPKY